MNPLYPYGRSLALLTDQYQLTMAYGYWKLGRADTEAVFHLTYRTPPFGGRFVVSAGLEAALGYLEQFRFTDADLEYLHGLEGRTGAPLFEEAFLRYLESLRLTVDVDAVPEGTPMFPHAPLLRLQGPILQAQLLETPLLNLINFPTLVATKAARIAQAADGGAVMEFGLRRAQGIDGGLAASRAAYVGGCASTSNVLAGRVFGIPVKGTHAHSWVMSYEDERDAFAGFAEVMPDDCVLLVDTYDSEVGVRRAVEVGRQLQRQGHRLAGIRLDSGDLKALAQMARRTLDEAGLTEAAVVASGDLDEHRIAALRAEGAPIDLWGVGTRLATASDDPALGGIYKLSAYREPGGDWRPRLKVSDSASKSTLPGVLQVRRFRQQGAFVKDVIYDIHDGAPKDAEAVDLEDGSPLELPGAPREPVEGADLLVPVLREGAPVYEPPALPQVQRAAQAELGRLPEAVRRLSEPAAYPVGITPALHRRRQRLTRDALATSDGEPEER